MSVVLNDLLLFSCLTALVTGIVVAAAALLILTEVNRPVSSASRMEKWIAAAHLIRTARVLDRQRGKCPYRPTAALFRPFSSHKMMVCCVKPVARKGGSRWLPR